MFEQQNTQEEYVEIDLQDLETLLEKIGAFMKDAGRDDLAE